MARLARLDSLRNQVRQRADIENATARFSDSELNEYINQSYAELYDLLIAAGCDYGLNTTSIVTTAGIDTYSLPADFYKLRGVDCALSLNGDAFTVDRFSFWERNKYRYPGMWDRGTPVAYRETGSNLKFLPVPDGQAYITVWYWQAPQRMSADGDTIDGVAGWEEYVVVDAATKVMRKDDRDAGPLMADKSALLLRILGMAANRDASQAEQVRDVWC